MVKKLAFWLIASAFIMLGLPWLAVTFAPGDAGMAICFLLFFGVNPIYALAAGALAGRDVRRLWSLSIIPSALFLLGAWLLFSPKEALFLLYAGVYLVLAVVAMALSGWILRRFRTSPR